MICDKLYECCEDRQFSCAGKEKCIEYRDCRKEAVCEERKKRYSLLNDGGYLISKFHMDGGVVRDEISAQKCDFLLVIDDPDCPTAVFVELKGKDIGHALEQLQSSIDRYGAQLKRRVCARIVCNSVPRMFNDPAIKGLKRELAKRYRGTLAIYEKNRTEKYSDI